MKKLGKILAVAVATVLAVGVAGGCNSACADLDKKKADCAKNSDEAAKKIVAGTARSMGVTVAAE